MKWYFLHSFYFFPSHPSAFVISPKNRGEPGAAFLQVKRIYGL